jgi:glycosyltransferase involved in cell wall biosynthesis
VVALYVGDLKKGVSPAIRAVARIPGTHLVIVSPSPPAPYLELVREMNLERRVHFCPATPDVEQYYAAADLFLFPTLYEPFGMVILEAMACGLPVITSRAAGAGELISHLEDGWLLEDSWNVDELVDALRRLVGDAEMRAQLGRCARQRAEQFTWDHVAERTLEVYRRAGGREKSHCQ